MKERTKCMILGGCLVLAGFLVGRAGLIATPRAEAVTTLPGDYSPFKSGNGAIISSSADGKTLYIWAPRGNQREQLWDRALPVYMGSVTANR